MNDLEQRVREVLDEDGRAAPRIARAPERLRSRVRRRQARTTVIVSLVSVVIVVVGAIGLAAITPNRTTPATGVSVRTGTVEGVTIEYPNDWFLTPLDGETLSSRNGPDGGGWFAFRPLLELTNFDPRTATNWVCPFPSGTIPGGGVVMYIQAVNRTIDAGEPGTWPVQPAPDALARSAEGACPLDSHVAAWTADGVTYEAFLHGSGADYDRLLGAFRSMTFQGGIPAVAGPIPNALPWVNEGGSLAATGDAFGETWKVSTDAGGITVTIAGNPDRETVVAWPNKGWSLTRRLHADRAYDALALVLTDLDVTRVCVASEGEWCGGWIPARDTAGDEARLWVIAVPGAGSGRILLNGRDGGSISWPPF